MNEDGHILCQRFISKTDLQKNWLRLLQGNNYTDHLAYFEKLSNITEEVRSATGKQYKVVEPVFKMLL